MVSATSIEKDHEHELFFNRELSWLEFNRRVLNEALDDRNPLFERLKFLGIFGNNLDEFFMKRVGGLTRQIGARVRRLSIDGMSPIEQLEKIRSLVIEMITTQRDCLLDTLVPTLRENGLTIKFHSELTEAERAHAREHFHTHTFPLLTPLAVDPGHPFPYLSNLSLSLAVRLRIPKSPGVHFARVKIPSNVSRWMHLPETNSFVPLEDVVADNLVELFPGTEILEVQSFRITRNADVDRNEEEAEDLLDMIEEELRHRRFNDIVRVEISESMSESLRSWLKTSLGVGDEDLYAVKGPLALRDLLDLDGEVDLPGIRFEPHTGVTHPRLRPLDEDDCDQTIFDVIRAGDFLVHHPYQSFSSSVLRFLESAASDPKVLAIKGTLYRTAKNSPIIKALVKAAENGKQVVVMVEIRARFDEANNIEWVHVLENVGAHVAYGVVGLKTHTKTFAVLRQDEDGLRQYCHIGTGNYHTGTAKLYTDVGLFTCDPGFGNDLVHLFNFITGHSRFRNYQHLLIGPLNMRRRFVEMIRREATKHTPERPGRIIAKMNQLEDKDIMMELYRASQAGVQIDLIIRGFCCLRAGVPGLSDNIRVMSTIGRFLEHSRIFYFHNGGDDEIYIGSADWMYRNLDRRVEAAAPVRHPALKQSLKDILDAHLKDQRQTWDLHADGKYVQRKPVEIDEGVGVQERLITTPACS